MKVSINRTVIEDFDLYNDGNLRKLYWRLGDSFKGSKEKIVIIVHDAHNFFEDRFATFGTGWKIHEVLEKMNISNYLVAGLECKKGLDRIREYSPVENRDSLIEQNDFKNLRKTPYHGDKYAKKIVMKIIPFLSQKFMFDFNESQTVMIGSSMGGIITTYFALEYPSLFNAYLAFSNAFYANSPYIYDYINSKSEIGKYYHDMGGKEYSSVVATNVDYIDGFKWMENYLKEINADHLSLFDQEGEHNEFNWNKRLMNALNWALERK